MPEVTQKFKSWFIEEIRDKKNNGIIMRHIPFIETNWPRSQMLKIPALYKISDALDSEETTLAEIENIYNFMRPDFPLGLTFLNAMLRNDKEGWDSVGRVIAEYEYEVDHGAYLNKIPPINLELRSEQHWRYFTTRFYATVIYEYRVEYYECELKKHLKK